MNFGLLMFKGGDNVKRSENGAGDCMFYTECINWNSTDTFEKIIC